MFEYAMFLIVGQQEKVCYKDFKSGGFFAGQKAKQSCISLKIGIL